MVGLVIPKDLGGPFPIKITAQRTPEVALQKCNVRYNLKTNKVQINFNAQRTPEVALQKGDLGYNLEEETQKERIAWSDHGSRGDSDYTSPEDIGDDDGAFGKSAEKDDRARRHTERFWTRCSASEETSTISIKSGNRMLKYLLPPKIKKKKKKKFYTPKTVFFPPNLFV